MSAVNCSAANIQRRADEFIDAQALSSNGGTDDIHNRINRANFVEMDFLERDVVNLCLSRTEFLEN